MPATGPELTRRTLFLLAVASRLRADSEEKVWDVISAMATDLSSRQAERFLTAFDHKMPGFDQLRSNVTALLEQGEVTSSVDLVSNEGDDQSRSVEVDWLLVLKRIPDSAGVVRRQDRVKCNLNKQGKTWRIVALNPPAFFAPIPG